MEVVRKVGRDVHGMFLECLLSECFKTYHTRLHDISGTIGFVHFNAVFFSRADVLHPDGAKEGETRRESGGGIYFFTTPAQLSEAWRGVLSRTTLNAPDHARKGVLERNGANAQNVNLGEALVDASNLSGVWRPSGERGVTVP